MAVLTSACDDFATPAELEKPQIVAVRAEPPAVAPGQTSELSLLLLGPDGEVDDAEISWSVVATSPGAPLLGTVETDGDGRVFYTAPSVIEDGLTIGTVQVDVSVADRQLSAIKAIALGAGLSLINPELSAFYANEDNLIAGQSDGAVSLAMTSEQEIELAVETTPELSAQSTFAWYSTVGELEDYQSNPAQLIAGDRVGDGWLFVVVRDGLGGVVWQRVSVSIEE